MKLDKTVKYAYYKNLKLNKKPHSIVNKGKKLIALSNIVLTSAFNPIIAEASGYYESSAISGESFKDAIIKEKIL